MPHFWKNKKTMNWVRTTFMEKKHKVQITSEMCFFLSVILLFCNKSQYFYELNMGLSLMLETVITIFLIGDTFPSPTECQLVHRAILRLNVNEQVEFEVSFCSDKPQSVRAKMSLHVEDNQYSTTTIRMTGVAYQEIVSLDNIAQVRSSQEMDQEDNEGGKRRKEGRTLIMW